VTLAIKPYAYGVVVRRTKRSKSVMIATQLHPPVIVTFRTKHSLWKVGDQALIKEGYAVPVPVWIESLGA
jgi:hypothetical protein